MRWKAHYFEQDKEDEVIKRENFGLKSEYSPPKIEGLRKFEEDLFAIVKSIEFKKVKNDFMSELESDLKSVQRSKELFVFADKSNNLYKMPKTKYDKLLYNNITKTYQKASDDLVYSINNDAKNVAKTLEIDNRMEILAKKDAFITLKDHKENFRSKPTCRLINPAKTELGLVSKKCIEKIHSDVIKCTGLNQWKNSISVIEWFNSVADKSRAKFVKFDIVNFYPSISQDLLQKSINFAKNYSNISVETEEIIMKARKSLLFCKGSPWRKLKQNNTFDVTMGSYDGAEVCELVGAFLLNELKQITGIKNMGLYRDDGLAIVSNSNGPKMDKIRKLMTELFKKHELQITIETNLQQTDFLDVSFDLSSNTFSPFCKPNNTPLYINAKSNHPPLIIKQIPKMISTRISNLSSNEQVFDKAKPIYEKALNDSGYPSKLLFNPSTATTSGKRTRKRKIIWFNPPFSLNVKTNIGKCFLKLLDKHFPKDHKYHKIFNRNTVKISYSCMENMEHQIRRTNSKLLKNDCPRTTKLCNCRNKDSCPLNGLCLSESIVYKATVVSDNQEKYYYGLTEGQFKIRYRNHIKSFNNFRYYHETELSKFVWDLKQSDKPFKISWTIVAQSATYKCGSRKCDLCLTEKLAIATANTKGCLNKRDEIMSKCRHSNKFKVKAIK